MPTGSQRNDDPLNREVEAALDGINLQDLDEHGEPPKARKGGSRFWRGTVVGASGDDVIVELGPRVQGLLARSEFGEEGPTVGKSYDFSPRGQEEDGLWRLSLGEARARAAWEELVPGAMVEARVTGVNTGGLELRIGTIEAFMPASHVALERIDDLSSQLSKTFVCEVLEADPERRRVLLSRRSVLQAERSEALAATVGSLSVGDSVSGKVTRVEAFGAFVQIAPGVEGLLHVSNISHKRVENPSEVLKKDQEVRVRILSIEEGGRRIGLGMKQLEPDPWLETAGRLSEGEIVSGTVTKLMDFGAFVELAPGVEGLVHISQLVRDRVRKASEVVKVGEALSVRVLSVDMGAKRIALSRLDDRGAVIGSEDAVEGAEIDRVLDASNEAPLATNLGNLFKKAMGGDGK